METEGIIGLESFDPDQECFCEEPEETIYVRFTYQGRKCTLCPRCGGVRSEIDFGEMNTTFEDDISEAESPTLDPELQISKHNQKVDSPEKAAILTPGSHIAWVRERGKRLGFIPGNYSHHAVVEKNDGEYLDIIHYAIDMHHNKVIRIHRKRLCLASHNEMGYDDLHVINYPQRSLQKNPPSLVLERAVKRLGEQHYHPVLNNSESFVNFCKTGSALTLQASARLESCINKIGGTLSSLAKKPKVVMWANQLLTKEAIKDSLLSVEDSLPRVIEDSLHVITEGMICTSDMDILYEDRKDEGMNRNSFEDKVVSELINSLATFLVIAVVAGATIGFTAGLYSGFSAGSVVPGIGNIIGGAAGGAVGLSTGWVIAKFLRSKRWPYFNKETITLIEKLRIGDHIVIPNESVFHRPCHGIVSDIKKYPHRISIIRYLPERGVVEEEKPFKKMKRIKYGLGECNHPREVVRRARSKLGQVNLPAMDGEKFAESQKKKAKKRASENEMSEETQNEKRSKRTPTTSGDDRHIQRINKDEAIKKKDKLYREEYVDQQGGDLVIPEANISLHVPEGALKEGVILSLTVPHSVNECLPDVQASPRLTPVVICEPDGLSFQKPVTLTIPHCAVIENPEKHDVYVEFGKKNKHLTKDMKWELEPVDFSLNKRFCSVSLNHFSGVKVDIGDIKEKILRVIPYTTSQIHPQGLVVNVWFCNDVESDFQHVMKAEEKNEGAPLDSYDTFILRYDDDLRRNNVTIALEQLSGTGWILDENQEPQHISVNTLCTATKSKCNFRLRHDGRNEDSYIYISLTVTQILDQDGENSETTFIIRKKISNLRLVPCLHKPFPVILNNGDLNASGEDNSQLCTAVLYMDPMKTINDDIIVTMWLCPSDSSTAMFQNLDQEQEMQFKHKVDAENTFTIFERENAIITRVRLQNTNWFLNSKLKKLDTDRIWTGSRAKFQFICHKRDDEIHTPIDLTVDTFQEATETQIQFTKIIEVRDLLYSSRSETTIASTSRSPEESSRSQSRERATSSGFENLVTTLTNRLSQDNCDYLTLFFDFQQGYRDNVLTSSNPQSTLLAMLEERELLRRDILAPIQDALRAVQRFDLATIVAEYKREHPH